MTIVSIRNAGERSEPSVAATSGTLTSGAAAAIDPTFGDGGFARPAVLGRTVAMLSQPDSKLVHLSTRISSFLVTRLDRDGHPDPSFGDAGVATVGLTDQAVLGRALAVQADGRILAFGTAKQPGPIRMFLVRLAADGRLDPSFSGDGRLTVTFGAAAALDAAAVVVQSDGRVIVVGSARTDLSSSSTGRLVAARFQPDGALDLGYGVLGKIDLPVPGFLARPTAAALDAAGNLLVAGHTYMSDTESDMFVMRLRTDGAADTAFGTNGLVINDFGTGNETTGGLAVQADGRIVVAGSAQQALHSTRPALLRLLPDGHLDPEFGSAGRVVVDLGVAPGLQVASGVALLPDSRLVIAGRAADQFGDDGKTFEAVITADGVLDTAAAPAFAGPIELGSALAVQPDGTPVAAFTVGSPESPVVVRFRRPTDPADLADVALTLSPDKASAGPGPLTFTAVVSNAGPAAARGVQLTITTSKAISVPESTQGKVVLESSRIHAVVLIGTVPASAHVTVTFRTTVTGFEGTITAEAVLATVTPDRTDVDHRRTVEVLTSRLETE